MAKVKRVETKRKSNRYDEAERLKLLGNYQKLRDEGAKADNAASAVGVPYITLRTWQKNIEQGAGKSKTQKVARGARVKKVKRAPKAEPTSCAAVTLVLTDGTRVECASPVDAAEFIKANR